MRSAGCIVNDILDRKFDQKVTRTKNRPIASGKISVWLALFYACFLCLIALLVLINFNTFTIILALGSMPLAFTYPLMKRYTYWPQLFLGITFNYGLILGWTSINEGISVTAIILYLGAIFWTLGYDTVYGYQDIQDDEIIGLKSTSIKFKNNAKKFLITCYAIFFISLIVVGINMNFKTIYYPFLILPLLHIIFIQIKNFNSSNSEICLKIFKSNNFFGFIVFATIVFGKVV
jgi:4-hydroxybenzoate polyprenyltransferase